MHLARLLLLAALVSSVGAAPSVEIPNASQPQLALSSDGRVWLAYGHATQAAAAPAAVEPKKHGGHQPARRPGSVYVACSTDGGATFSSPLKVAEVPDLMLGNRRGPRVAAHGDRITVTLVAHELIAFTSTDAGRTWSSAVAINDVPDSAREGLHDCVRSPEGDLFATWLDLRNGKMEVWSAASIDGGRTWSKNEQVYRSPDKSVCECCHPSALFDADGNLAVMWRNSLDGSRDMWMATRPKGQGHFTPAHKLGEGTWKLNACPMDGGRIALLGQGKFGAVWMRDGDVFLSDMDAKEIRLGRGRHPVVASTSTGPLVVWNDGTNLVYVRDVRLPLRKQLATDARFSSIVSLPDDAGVLVAYEKAGKGESVVIVDRL